MSSNSPNLPPVYLDLASSAELEEWASRIDSELEKGSGAPVLDGIFTEGILALTDRAPRITCRDHLVGTAILAGQLKEDLDPLPFLARLGRDLAPLQFRQMETPLSVSGRSLPDRKKGGKDLSFEGLDPDASRLFWSNDPTRLTLPVLDLFFQTGLSLGVLDATEIPAIMNELIPEKYGPVFRNPHTAHRFGQLYLMIAERLWSNLRLVVYHRFAGALLGDSPEGGDGFFSDAEALEWIKEHEPDAPLYRLLISPDTEVFVEHHDPMFYFRWPLRYVDPRVLVRGQEEKLSDIRDDFAAYLEREWDRVRGIHGISVRHPGIPLRREYFENLG